MYNNIVKIAKNIIAKNEAKKLLEYLKNNIVKLSPMTKLKFEQFLRSEELDY